MIDQRPKRSPDAPNGLAIRPWPLQAHGCCQSPDCGPATKDWHLIAGISRGEKIPEKIPKIEI